MIREDVMNTSYDMNVGLEEFWYSGDGMNAMDGLNGMGHDRDGMRAENDFNGIGAQDGRDDSMTLMDGMNRSLYSRDGLNDGVQDISNGGNSDGWQA